MEADSLQARIQHESAELMALHPHISVCRATLDKWQEGSEERYSLRLDIRWPQHQSLISRPARGSAEGALRAAFDAAAQQLSQRSP
jgi:hypothetical protein